MLSKLILLPPAEIDRLVRDLGGSAKLGAPNVILGVAGTLDGSNQWHAGAGARVRGLRADLPHAAWRRRLTGFRAHRHPSRPR